MMDDDQKYYKYFINNRFISIAYRESYLRINILDKYYIRIYKKTKKIRKNMALKFCRYCEKQISEGRAGRRIYCSTSCKQADYRKRKGKKQVKINISKGGYVYFIKDSITGLIKIGKAKHVEKRLSILQIGNSKELKIIKIIKTINAELLEKKLHRKFAIYRKNGEWFEIDQDQLSDNEFELWLNQTELIIQTEIDKHSQPLLFEIH